MWRLRRTEGRIESALGEEADSKWTLPGKGEWSKRSLYNLTR